MDNSSIDDAGRTTPGLTTATENGSAELLAAPSLAARLEPEGEPVGGTSRGRSAWGRAWRSFSANRLAVIGLCGIALLVLAAAIGPLVYSQSPTDADIFNLTPDAWPSAAHPLGTDSDGVDILARLLSGLRVSLGVALFVETLNVLLGVPLGLIAGYFGGPLDFVLSRAADVLFAFPGLLLAILVAGVFGPGIGDTAGGLGRLALVTGALAVV